MSLWPQVRTEKILTEHNLWDDRKRFERKGSEERDDMSCRIKNCTRETNPLRQSFQSNREGQIPDRIRVFSQTRECSDKSLQLLVDNLRQQNSNLQSYYK